MRQPISGGSSSPPLRGRRVQPIASPKANAEDRPNARDLLATVNSASEGAAATWLAFLGTMAYLAVTLGGVTHVDLLLNNDTTLPFVNVKVPLATFFVMAPLAFVLVHFSLLLQHVMLSRKLAAFEERLTKEERSRDRDVQNIRDELHSFTFTQVASGKPKSAVVDIAQRLVISLTLVVLPMLLLTFFQIGFLAYHSEPITWWHRIMLALDVGIVWCLARHLVRIDPASKIRLTDWWHATSRLKWRLIIGWRRVLGRVRSAIDNPASPDASLACTLFSGARRGGTFVIRSIAPTRVVIVLLVLFSVFVATLPDEPLDRVMASIPHLSENLPYDPPREGTVREIQCPTRNSKTRCAFYLTALLFEREVNQTTGKSDGWLSWSRNLIVTDKQLVGDDKKATRLNLRGRDLRYATLDRSNLQRADFFKAEHGGARLIRSDLNWSSFSGAQLQHADLRRSRLQGADLTGANFQGANLHSASLQVADLSWAGLDGANLIAAGLQGAYLFYARLQGVEAVNANLRAAYLGGANLQGAILSRARLQGSDLSANLQGTFLIEAEMQGSNLRSAELQGSDLRAAKIWDVGMPQLRDIRMSFALLVELDMRPLDEMNRASIREDVALLERLSEESTKESPFSRENPSTLKKIGLPRLRQLLNAKDDDKWKAGDDFKSWCMQARLPSPNPAKLSAFLGTVACRDDTDQGYMARILVRRALDLVDRL